MKKVITDKLMVVSFMIVSVVVLYACDDTYVLDPVVYTYEIPDSVITATSVKVTGQIQLLGTIQIPEHGVELYKETITNLVATKSFNTVATTDTFTVSFTGLQPSTKYYAWAYALVNTTRVHPQAPRQFTTKATK